MVENLRPVPISEIIVSAELDDVLVVYGLGSCVVICLYDPLAQVGGMLHALLPTSINGNNNNNNNAGGMLHSLWSGSTRGKNKKAVGKPTKFVDQGVPLLINSLVELGARPSRLVAQVCGGARMLTASGFNGSLNIGRRNVLAAKTALQAANLEIWGRSTGGHIGRTVKLYIASGQVTVKTLGKKERTLKIFKKSR